MANGWAISVSIQGFDGTWSEPEIWYAAIEDELGAVEAVKKVVGYTEDGMKVEAKTQIPETTLEALNIGQGKEILGKQGVLRLG